MQTSTHVDLSATHISTHEGALTAKNIRASVRSLHSNPHDTPTLCVTPSTQPNKNKKRSVSSRCVMKNTPAASPQRKSGCGSRADGVSSSLLLFAKAFIILCVSLLSAAQYRRPSALQEELLDVHFLCHWLDRFLNIIGAHNKCFSLLVGCIKANFLEYLLCDGDQATSADVLDR